MSLKAKLKDSVHGLKGLTPPTRDGAKNTSTLHYNSSITDNPDILAGQSELSLKGEKPSYNYMDNLPEKAVDGSIRANATDLTGTNTQNRG
tara:strand:- start:773 stop:1045 length:273 start_codon:yes stop_codon:yes gene_type:complete